MHYCISIFVLHHLGDTLSYVLEMASIDLIVMDAFQLGCFWNLLILRPSVRELQMVVIR